jgi:anti-sigma-K factor RskA
MTITPLTEDDVTLAAEMVLGLLDASDQAQAAARVTSDPAFAMEVAAWQRRLTPMLDGADEVPPEHIWNAIQTKTAPDRQQDRSSWGVGFWKGISALSTAAAVTFGAMLLSRLEPIQVQPAPLVAAIAGASASAVMTASYDPATHQLTLTPVKLDTGKLYPELWVIPAGGTAHSLGIVTSTRPTIVRVPDNVGRFIVGGATLAVTPEPAGGAPAGKATGPVIASGTITQI